MARFGGYLIGAYYLKPNFVGRAAHIANAGYFVLAPYRSTGVGRTMVEHSLREARRLGFDAMQFNLVFESNPARGMYRKLGFEEVGRIPEAVEGEDALIYWRSLADIRAVSGPDVSVERHGEHVAVVCLHRPPNNYFDTALIAAVASAYEALDESGWCRAIVLASEGRHFCAGLDFAANAGQDIAELYRAALRLFAAPLPVVAAVQGAAIGGGCGLALSADFRVATPAEPLQRQLRRASASTTASRSTVTLPATVGRQAAADLLLTGRRVGGERGARPRPVRPARPRRRGRAAGRRRSPTPGSWPPPARWRSAPSGRRCAAAWWRRPGSAMAHECAEQLRLRDSADFAEGVRAAAERREPRFSGS